MISEGANGYTDPKLKMWCGCGGSVLECGEDVMLRRHEHDLLEAVFSERIRRVHEMHLNDFLSTVRRKQVVLHHAR